MLSYKSSLSGCISRHILQNTGNLKDAELFFNYACACCCLLSYGRLAFKTLTALARLFHLQYLVGCYVFECLHRSRGPANFDFIGGACIAKAEVDRNIA